MINLLPTEQRNHIRHEYYARMSVVILVLAGLTFLVASGILAARYIGLVYELRGGAHELAMLSREYSSKGEELRAEVQKINNEIRVLQAAQRTQLHNDALPFILDAAQNVALTYISYRSEDAGKEVRISGIASSRSALASFVESLQTRFENVEVPVSDFVQNTNIEFSLTILL